MIDWRILDRLLGCEPAAAKDAAPRHRWTDEHRRLRASLAMLPLGVALSMLPGLLWAQGASGADRPTGAGKAVVVEQSPGEIDFSAHGAAGPPSAAGSRVAPSAASARAARLVHFGGMVRDTLDGTTLGGARIELLGTRFSARSAEDGHFRLGLVPAGLYTIRVTRIGYEPIVISDVRLPEDLQDVPLGVTLRRRTVALSEMIVTPGHFGLLQPGLAGSQSLTRETLETIPQLGEDIYRAVSRLPGASADDFSAKFNVRGGFSIIDIQTLGTASLNTGGFSAEYGDRLAGVFTLTTSDPRTDGVHGSVGVSAM